MADGWVSVLAEPGMAVVRLSGELDVEHLRRLQGLLDEIAQGEGICFDLRTADFIDSTILGALTARALRTAKEGGSVQTMLPRTPNPVTRLLDLAGVHEVLNTRSER